jgi:hypothetical protein
MDAGFVTHVGHGQDNQTINRFNKAYDVKIKWICYVAP